MKEINEISTISFDYALAGQPNIFMIITFEIAFSDAIVELFVEPFTFQMFRTVKCVDNLNISVFLIEINCDTF